jgi:hypothetical protein
MGLRASTQDFIREVGRAAQAQGRDVLAIMDEGCDAVRFYDREYGMVLGHVDGGALRHALVRGGSKAFQQELCAALREPTSLEILTFAQLTGPHVGGA